jgi:hypothetical protein
MSVTAFAPVEREAKSDFNKRRWAWLKGVTADSELSPGAKILASVLVTQFPDVETGACFPGNEKLAEALGGISHDTIQRAFRALSAGGWLHRTEGRGRGNFSVVVFHFRAEVVKLHPHEKPGQNAPAMTAQKAAELRFQAKEKAAELRSKGRKSAASHIEPNSNQTKNAQASANHVGLKGVRVAVAPGSDDEAAWDQWLEQQGYDRLAQFAARVLVGGQCGYGAPDKKPPTDGDMLAIDRARRWALQAGEQGASHDR